MLDLHALGVQRSNMTVPTDLQVFWGQRLEVARRNRGLSLGKLAEMAQIDRANLSRIERGLVNSGDDARMRIASALDLRVEDIWAYPDTREAS